jgi:predicted PurR-regulated permease PerM
MGKNVNQQLGIDIVNDELVKSAALKISSFVPAILNSSVSFVTTLCVMLFLLYYFIKEGSSMRREVLALLPLKESNRNLLYKLFYQSVMSNALMMPLVALFQAIIALIGYLGVGVNNALIWFIATFFASMIPFFGAALVYVPLGILMIAKGAKMSGIFVLLWGFLVVSTSDSAVRIFLMKKYDNTHPLITFLGVFAGLNIFGFLGIVFGPLLISLFLILIKIYREEYRN